MLAQEGLGRLGGAVGVPAKESQVVIPGIPDPVILAVVAPVRFVAMDHGQGADFLQQVRVEGPPAAHRLALKAKGAGRHELQAEEVGEEAADFAVRGVEFVAQVEGGGFGGRTNVGAGQFAGAGGVDVPVTGGAMDLFKA